MNERIQVLAKSYEGMVEPLQFLFKNKLYTIKEVSDYQEEMFRGSMQYYISVNLIPDGNCELHFDLFTGQWTLINGTLPS